MHDIEVHEVSDEFGRSSRDAIPKDRRIVPLASSPTANEQNRRCTERLENCCVINARVGLRLRPVPEGCLAKVRRFGSRKAIQNQPLTSSVLNPRSREVQRQPGPEREFRVPAGAPQSGGFRAKPAVIGLPCALEAGGECWSQ